MIVFSFYVSRNEIHRAGPVQGNAGDDILKALRPQLLHEVLHSGALQLEDSLRLSGSDICQHLWIIVVNVVNVHPLARRLLDKVHRIPYNCEVPQTQKVHFQKSQLLQRRHRELRDDRTVASP